MIHIGCMEIPTEVSGDYDFDDDDDDDDDDNYLDGYSFVAEHQVHDTYPCVPMVIPSGLIDVNDDALLPNIPHHVGRLSERVTSQLDKINYLDIIASGCCRQACIARYSWVELRHLRGFYLSMSHQASRQWLQTIHEQHTSKRQYAVGGQVSSH